MVYWGRTGGRTGNGEGLGVEVGGGRGGGMADWRGERHGRPRPLGGGPAGQEPNESQEQDSIHSNKE